MDILTVTAIQEALTTTFVGRPVHYWASIGSTMDEARRLAEAGAPEGTVVLADEQTAGRGRLQAILVGAAGEQPVAFAALSTSLCAPAGAAPDHDLLAGRL